MVSICIQYYNRKQLLINTLESIRKSEIASQVEIIIVDDASDEAERIEDLVDVFSDLNIIIHRYEPEEKWWYSPIKPINKSVASAANEKIILLCAECVLVNDIPKYVEDNLIDNTYIVFGTFGLGESENINNFTIISAPYSEENQSGWYQHSNYRPLDLNFCTAIMKSDFIKIDGFDIRYAKGYNWGDADFIKRIRKNKIFVTQVDDFYALHQYHKRVPLNLKTSPQDNMSLFNSIWD